MMLNAFTDASNVMDSFHDQGLFCTEGAQCA